MTSKNIILVSVIMLCITIPLIIIIQYSNTESTKIYLPQDDISADIDTKDTNDKHYINLSQILRSKNHSELIVDNAKFYSINENQIYAIKNMNASIKNGIIHGVEIEVDENRKDKTPIVNGVVIHVEVNDTAILTIKEPGLNIQRAFLGCEIDSYIITVEGKNKYDMLAVFSFPIPVDVTKYDYSAEYGSHTYYEYGLEIDEINGSNYYSISLDKNAVKIGLYPAIVPLIELSKCDEY